MAYEAYIATVEHIAKEALVQWRTGNDAGAVLERLAKDANVDLGHCRGKLTQLIKAQHLDNQLTR